MNDKEYDMNRQLRLALWSSGWIPVNKKDREICFDDNDYDVCKKDFLYKRYETTIFAVMPNKLDINGQFGISWVEGWYEYQERAFSWADLEDMQHAITLAEKNLLLCEIPFCDDTTFHGTPQEIRWKINRNKKVRKKWKLDELEEELGWRNREQCKN